MKEIPISFEVGINGWVSPGNPLHPDHNKVKKFTEKQSDQENK